MKLKQNEGAIIKEIEKVVKDLKGEMYRLNCQQRGVPDIIVKLPLNKTGFFIEVKTAAAKVTKIQEKFLQTFGGVLLTYYENKKPAIRMYNVDPVGVYSLLYKISNNLRGKL